MIAIFLTMALLIPSCVALTSLLSGARVPPPTSPPSGPPRPSAFIAPLAAAAAVPWEAFVADEDVVLTHPEGETG